MSIIFRRLWRVQPDLTEFDKMVTEGSRDNEVIGTVGQNLNFGMDRLTVCGTTEQATNNMLKEFVN